MDYLDWKSIGSIMATLVFLRAALHDFLPREAYNHLLRILNRTTAFFNPRMTILIDECYDSFHVNESATSSKCLLSTANVPRLSKPKNSHFLTFTMAENATQSLHDRSIPDLPVEWSLHAEEQNKHNSSYRRHYKLSFHKRHKERVHEEYIPYVMAEAAGVKFKSRERRLYTNRSGDGSGHLWSHVPFHHPAKFETLAVDPVVMEDIMTDLTEFVGRQEYYSRVGRSWKRGYLLHGPPGTGKTSLVAAIANFLEFDIYDLELTAVTSNSELRKLLVSTTSKSIIVVEDIDCTLDLSSRGSTTTPDDDNEDDDDKDEDGNGKKDEEKKRKKKNTVSLSGVLNFVDGLWSSCVGERLMIFTTNHVDKLDAALLRAGRMDKHIHHSYCHMPAFKILAKNYLYVEVGDEKYTKVMTEEEELLPKALMTPADIAEVFMSCNDDAAARLRMVAEELRHRVAKLAVDASVVESSLQTQDDCFNDDNDNARCSRAKAT